MCRRMCSFMPSANNEEYIWNELEYFSSPANVSRFLKKRNPTLIAKISEIKGIEISSCITQARQYYHSARDANYAIKPLLEFYCFESLTAALLMILKKEMMLRDFKQRHGVKLIPYELKESQTNLSRIFVQFQEGGLFTELFKADLWDWAILRTTDPNKPKVASGFKMSSRKIDFLSQSVSLLDLLSLVPEISDTYRRIFESEPRVFSGDVVYHLKGNQAEKIDLLIQKETGQITEDLLIEKMPELKTGYDREEKDAYFRFTCSPEAQAPLVCEDIYGYNYIKAGIPAYRFTDGGTKPSSEQLQLLDLEVHFLTMYTFSVLCRYKLRLWNTLMVKKKQGLDHVIKRFVEISSSKFPLLIWREILNAHIQLMPPGTILRRYR